MGPKVVFFDIGNTLGVPSTTPAGSVTSIELFPFIPQILGKMKASEPEGFGARLGIISNTPDSATMASMSALLSAAGILELFTPGLLLFSSVEGMDKTQTAFFTRAVTRSAVAAGRCIFVGESDPERTTAKTAGMLTSFHPLHAFDVLKKLS